MLGPVMMSMRRDSSKPQIIRDEGFAPRALDHRMASAVDEQRGFLDQFRLDALKRLGPLGEAAQDIDLRNRRRGCLQLRQVRAQNVQQAFVQLSLARLRAVARAQHLVLEGF